LLSAIVSSRPTVFICRRCELDATAHDGDELSGQTLYDNVKALRKQLQLQELFSVEQVKCLGLCDTPCAVEFSGKKKSTYLRGNVHPTREAQLLVQAAVSYAQLPLGAELPERKLPGVDVD
jgi:predicted metal-binding protein